MRTALLIVKEKILSFYAKAGVYLNHVFKFALAFISFLLIGNAIGTNQLFANPVICLGAALLCAFLPINVTVICATVFALIHLYGMSLALAIIATIVVLVIYLLYFRFAPNTGFILILTPLLFYIKIPYVIPVIAALSVGISGIIPMICGTFFFFLIKFAAEYTTAITTLDADSIVQNITFIFNNVLNNRELLITVITFSVVCMMIFLIRKLSVNYSWIIAIVSGCVVNAIVFIVSYTIMDIDISIAGTIGSTFLAILIGLIMNLFVFSVDYSATEYVQFEDNDYYYYVKAVPKVSVTKRNVTIKKFNSGDQNTGFIHTESYEELVPEDSEEEI